MQTFKKKNITTIIILLLLPLTLISIYTIKQYFSRASGFTFKVTKNHQLSCTEQVENGNHVIVKVIDEAGAPLSGVTVEYWPDYNYPNSASANAPQGEGVTTGGQLDFNNLWPGCLSTCPDGKTNQMVKYFFKIKDQSSDTAAEISSGIWGNECAGAGYGSFCNINAVNVWGHWAYEIIFQKKAGDLAVDEIPTDHAGQAIVPADKRSACTYFDFYTPNQGFNPRRTGTTTPSSTPPAGGSPTPTPTSISLSNYCVDGFYKIPGEPVCSRAPFCGNNNSYALCEGGIPAVDPRSQDCMGDGDGQRVGCRGKPPLCCYEMARTGDPMMCCGSWERNWCYPSQCAKIDPEKSKICNGGTPGTCACGSATKATGPYCDKPGDILVDPPFSLEKRLGITPPTASTPTPSTTPYPLTPTPSSSPTPTITPTPTGNLIDVKINLKLKFQGIASLPKTNSMKVKIKLANYNYQIGDFTADASGIWSGAVSFKNVTKTNSYFLFIKGPKHLQKKFSKTLTAGENNIDLTNTLLMSGDLAEQDGIIDSYDISLVRNYLGKIDAASLRIADINLDSIVDTQDYSLLITTLTSVKTNTDEL